jgi:hypothetical protein
MICAAVSRTRVRDAKIAAFLDWLLAEVVADEIGGPLMDHSSPRL